MVSPDRVLTHALEIRRISVSSDARSLISSNTSRVREALKKLHREIRAVALMDPWKISDEIYRRHGFRLPIDQIMIDLRDIKKSAETLDMGNARIISPPIQEVTKTIDRIELKLIYQPKYYIKEKDIEIIVAPIVHFIPDTYLPKLLLAYSHETNIISFPAIRTLCSASPAATEICPLEYICPEGTICPQELKTLEQTIIREARRIVETLDAKGIYFTDIKTLDDILSDPTLYRDLVSISAVEYYS